VTNNPQLLFRYINTRLWSKAGHFNKALSKGPKTTTWVWNSKDRKHYLPSSHLVWSLIGQDILNDHTGQYFSAIRITSGIIQLWCSERMITQIHLKYTCCASLITLRVQCYT
jgi:hypothetical protein